ncbi:bifunctional polynucleotide phosphatase/kinase-like protein, partial [Piptocephalis cylindrospora]
DGTLIRVRGTHVHPRDRHDWQFWDECIPSRLRALVNKGFNVVILSNQAGLKRKKDGTRNAREAEWRAKVMAIVSELNIPIQVLGSIDHGVYRKPCPGMWHYLIEKGWSDGCKVDLTQSFYVGDAAGRREGWKKGVTRGDHSAADRKLALNVGLPFYTPEEYFFQEASAPYSLGDFDPTQFEDTKEMDDSKNICDELASKVEKGLILLVGAPASGKSTVWKKYFKSKGYTRINMDTLKSKAKCLKGSKEALAAGGRVVVDNTNGDRATRAEYLKLAKGMNLPCYVIWVNTGPEVCRHNNLYRSIRKGSNEEGKRERIPDVAFRTFYSRFQPPVLSEGFSSIEAFPFIPRFSNEEDREGWCQWME